MPHEEPEPGGATWGREYYDLRKFVAEEAAPQPPVERSRISARNLERVVSKIRDLPEAGELEVEVRRLVTLVFGEEAGEEVVDDSFDGPWVFCFAI